MRLRRLVVRLVLLAALGYGWWELAPWLQKPGSYRLVVAYLIIGVVAGTLHLYALWRFHRMLLNVRRDERLGLAEPGSEMFALNQRFRYAARSMEALLIVTVSLLGIAGLSDTGLVRTKIYIVTVVTYLVGTVVLTGYLTWRDLRVINFIRRQAAEDAASLRPILRYRSKEPTRD